MAYESTNIKTESLSELDHSNNITCAFIKVNEQLLELW